jgi:hypothetical protein
MGLKVFNRVPTYIKDIPCNVREFKHLLKISLIQILFICWSISNITIHGIFYS